MASNEEILKQAIPNFDNKDLPKFRVVFSRDFSDNVSQKILSSMDTARKDEAVGFEMWQIEHGIYRIKDTDMYQSDAEDISAASPLQLYLIFKQQNS